MPMKTKAHGMDEVKSVDSIGRVTLGTGFANKLVTVREVDDTEVVVTVVRVVPERDAALLGSAAPKKGAEHKRRRAGSDGMWAESKGSTRRIMRHTGKLSDAIAAALGIAGRPMSSREIAKEMLAKGLWADEGDGGHKLDRAVWNICSRRGRGGPGRFVKTAAGYAMAAPQ